MTTEANKVLSHFSATPEIPAFALECANDAVYIYDDNRRRTRQREKEQFRQIIDTSPVALLICERDTGIIRYTKLFAQRLFDGRESVCLAMMDVTEAHELSNQLSYQATYDDLTGLLNRREFEDRLQEVIELACERRSDNMLCYLDLDQFKVINDSCGHLAGDERLRVSRLNAALDSSHFEMMIRRLFAWFAANPEARKKVSLGRGLSSFAYLKSLPVDFVKIDGYFVKDILTDPVDLAIVKAIIDMARALGKKTIAEFVENEAILEQLIELNVDYVQGYGIARPQPLC